MKAATRERLLVAAERIAVREGFARVSLDRVAEAAGLTKGAIYSNFASKEDLLFEVFARLTPGLDFNEEVFTAGDLRAVLEKAATVLAEATRTRAKEILLAMEFEILVLRDAKLRRAMARERARATTEPVYLAHWMEAHGDELPLPAELFFDVLNAMALGLVQVRLRMGPEVITDEVMTWALTRFLPCDHDSSG
jgi:AcrR family transcriptional regulator